MGFFDKYNKKSEPTVDNNISAINNTSEAQPYKNLSFSLKIEDKCGLPDRGTVVTGMIQHGEIHEGQEAEIIDDINNTSIVTVVVGIERNRKIIKEAKQGDAVGLLLRGLEEKDVTVGSRIIIKQELPHEDKLPRKNAVDVIKNYLDGKNVRYQFDGSKGHFAFIVSAPSGNSQVGVTFNLICSIIVDPDENYQFFVTLPKLADEKRPEELNKIISYVIGTNKNLKYGHLDLVDNGTVVYHCGELADSTNLPAQTIKCRDFVSLAVEILSVYFNGFLRFDMGNPNASDIEVLQHYSNKMQ